MRILTCLAVFATAFLFVADANAQGRRGMQASPAVLVGLEQVQEELDLNDEQIEKINEMAEETRGNRGARGEGGRGGEGRGEGGRGQRGGEGGRGEGRQGGRGEGGRGEGRPGGRGGEGGRQGGDGARGAGRGGGQGGRGGGAGRGAEADDSAMAKLADILNEAQMKRLKQISVQVRGAAALLDEEMAEAIGLSEEDIETLEVAQEEANAEMREEMMDMFASGDREAAMEEMPKMRKAAAEKVFGLLSDEQKSKYDEMIGEPFEVDMRAMMQQLGGRRGGGAGGQRGQDGRGGGGRQGRPGGGGTR